MAAVSLSACKEVETESATGYEPATLKEVKGNEDVKLVTFTKEGAERTGVETEKVRPEGGRTVVPYTALIYDAGRQDVRLHQSEAADLPTRTCEGRPDRGSDRIHLETVQLPARRL